MVEAETSGSNSENKTERRQSGDGPPTPDVFCRCFWSFVFSVRTRSLCASVGGFDESREVSSRLSGIFDLLLLCQCCIVVFSGSNHVFVD